MVCQYIINACICNIVQIQTRYSNNFFSLFQFPIFSVSCFSVAFVNPVLFLLYILFQFYLLLRDVLFVNSWLFLFASIKKQNRLLPDIMQVLFLTASHCESVGLPSKCPNGLIYLKTKVFTTVFSVGPKKHYIHARALLCLTLQIFFVIFVFAI